MVKIVYAEGTDRWFLANRLAVAKKVLEQGHHVTVVCVDSGYGQNIREEGFDFCALPIARGRLAPIQELKTLNFFVRLYRQLKPDLVHHFTLKPVVFGTLAARLTGYSRVVNSITGLGYIFTDLERNKLARKVVEVLYWLTFRHPRSLTVVQNSDDMNFLIKRGLLPEARARLVRGSGVDCQRFAPVEEPQSEWVRVIMPGRILGDKGVYEFVEACRVLRERGVPAKMVLVGEPDYGHPTAIPVEELNGWVAEGLLDWDGHQEDMPSVYRAANIVVMASYREGLPKGLLEAAACARPVIATDVPGCREIARDGENGYRVPCFDGLALAERIVDLVKDSGLRKRFGQAGRRIVEDEFSNEHVVSALLQVYFELLGREI